MPAALLRLWTALKPGGAFYLSFKLGEGERAQDGRHFTDASEASLREWLRILPGMISVECWLTEDQRPERQDQWVNAIALRAADRPDKLVTGGDNPFLPHLCKAEVGIAGGFLPA